MRFFFVLFVVMVAALLDSGFAVLAHKKKHQLNLPHEVVFHGLNVDLDKFKSSEPIVMDTSAIEALEASEHKELDTEEDMLKKVETEYLGSDLHKEALTAKFYGM